MSNRRLRIVSHNVADSATITAANTAPGLGVEWLKTELKSEVCRILDNEATITLEWINPVTVDCVALPAWNGSSGSEIRARAYYDTAGAELAFDTGWEWAATGPSLGSYNFSRPLNVNNFNVNGFIEQATVSALWLPNVAARRVVLDIRDPNRTFLDISRIIVGAAFSACGVSYGSGASLSDTTTTTRTAGGDLKVDWGVKRRSINLNLGAVRHYERPGILQILNAGLGYRHFFSGFAGGGDPTLEQELMLYGVLASPAALTHATYRLDNTQFQIEEV